MDLRKQLITALGLTAVLAVLAAVYLFLNGNGGENGGGQTPLGDAYGIAPADIQKAQFRYADPSLPDMTLERVGGEWRLTEPIQAPAVQERAEALLRFLKQPVRKRVQGDMSEFGLTEPTVSVTLHTPSKTIAFLFGQKSVSYGMYVKEKSESGAFIMEAYLIDELLVSPSDLRDRRIVPLLSDKAARVQIERGGKPVVSIERVDPDADWRLVSPVKAAADQAAVQRFLDALLSFKAEQFLPPVDTNPSEWSAAVETFNGGRRVLYMERSAVEGRLLAADENGYAYEASDSFLAHLPKEAFAWREKRVADFQRTETTRVDVENRYGAFALERPSTASSEWRLVEPAERPADGGLMSDLLFQLDSAPALRILSEDGNNAAAYGFNRPRARIRFNGGSGAAIEIGAEVEGGAAVRSSMSPLIGAYRMEDLRGWMEGPAAFRSKQLFDHKTSDAKRIEIDNGRESFALARSGFVQWRIEKPYPEAANTEAVEQMNIGLRDLRAERFYSEPPPVSKTGLDRPRLTAALTLEDGRRIKLLFGKAGTDGVYARIEEDADIFIAPKEAFELLNASLDELRAKR